MNTILTKHKREMTTSSRGKCPVAASVVPVIVAHINYTIIYPARGNIITI